MNNLVYGLQEMHSHFGDHWATLSLLRYRARLQKTRPSFSYMHGNQSFLSRLREINDALGMEKDGALDCTPLLTDQPPTVGISILDVWSCPVVPTRRRWELPRTERTAVYQFDGVWSPEKNPSPEEQAVVLAHLRNAGYTPIRLGKHLSVAQCVDACATALLFVGCCSGMSHLAHSVGTPVYLLEYGYPVTTCHRLKQFVLCKGAAHFARESTAYIDFIARLTPTERVA